MSEPTKEESPWPRRRAKALAFVIEHWLPISFAIAVILALAWPYPGSKVVSVVVLGDVHIVQEVAMFIVFFLQGLALNTADLHKAKGHKLGVVYGFVAILFLTPLLGLALRYVPLQPQLFTVGLVIFCLVPTTLGIGVALVRSCKGNEGVALLLTVGSNMLGVGTMPGMLLLLFINYDTSNLSIRLDALNLLAKLSITILVPSVTGKLVREFITPARNFATKRKVGLGMIATALLAFIIWQNLSAARNNLFKSPAWSVISVIVLTSAAHIFYLIANYIVIRFLFRLPYPEAVSVVIMASQKSAPVGYTVVSYIAGTPQDLGLIAVPLIVGQVAQIFIGSALVPFLTKHAKAHAAAVAAKQSASQASEGGLQAPADVTLSHNTLSHTTDLDPGMVTDDLSEGKEPMKPLEAHIVELSGLTPHDSVNGDTQETKKA